MAHARKFKSNKRRRAARPVKKARKRSRKAMKISQDRMFNIILLAMLVTSGKIPEIVLEHIRWWHGNMFQQFTNVKGLYDLLMSKLSVWGVPLAIREKLGEYVTNLTDLMNKCNTNEASPADRGHRSTMLKAAVAYCLMDVMVWAYGDFVEGRLTADDVHEMNFLLPGERGGHRERSEPTDAIAEVKAKILNADFTDFIVDHAGDKNAAPVRHGWPHGINHAMLLVMEDDAKTVILHKITTTLHNEFKMPEGSHGKHFMVAAAFLKHVDDEPKFGNFAFFSMPKTAVDLVAVLDSQHHEDFEEHVRVVEQHRQDVERVHAEQNAAKD